MMEIRIGTRGSQLALWQANSVANRLSEEGYRPQLVIVKTTGDKRQDVSLASIGGKGLFVKELEEALAAREIDLAVHSLKDVPSLIPDRFVLAGFLKRADPRDAWVHPEHLPIDELPAGSIIGTSAPRRRAQLRQRYPRFVVEDIRGNVETRINKMHAGLYAGIILANAGLTRLGREAEITSLFDVDTMVPACGQGIIGLEVLRENADAIAAARAITDGAAERAALTERGVLQKFGDTLDCTSAVAVHSDGKSVRAFVSDLEGTRAIRAQGETVDEVYEALIAQGAMELLGQQG